MDAGSQHDVSNRSLTERMSISDRYFKAQLGSVHRKHLQRDDIQNIEGGKVVRQMLLKKSRCGSISIRNIGIQDKGRVRGQQLYCLKVQSIKKL